jgi:hypothetical protein
MLLAGLPAAPPDRLVVVAGAMTEPQLVAVSAAVAARPGTTLLLDSPALSPYLRRFLADFRPDAVWPAGTFKDGRAALEARLGVSVLDPLAPDEAVKRLLPDAPGLVVCPPVPREDLLRAATLAAARRLPLRVGTDAADLVSPHERPREVVAAGQYPRLRKALPRATKFTALFHARLVEAAYVELLDRPETAVITNPADGGAMSVLAPWLAASKQAALLFTGAKGDDVPAVLDRAQRKRALRKLDALILLADQKAIPTLARPNPIPADKDKVIDMEPLTPTGNEPYTYAVGRLFHADRAVVPLMLARQRLMSERKGSRRVLIASNPGSSLPLLETFSRSTARELSHTGYDVTALYARGLTATTLRKAMAEKDVILWEGHHNTLVKEWGFTGWDEPIGPSFVFLQSCLALMEPKVQPLLARGAVGVLGTSTRTYSGSGGAFSLAYLDAVAYEGQSLGGALRQAKNFLVVYSMLKKQRLGEGATRLGANQRAAWSFTLWGDPTFHLPRPAERPKEAVRHTVTGSTITLRLPSTWHRPEDTPNARLAGLVRKRDEKAPDVVPLVFAEVHLPRAPVGATPKLRSRLPGNNWVFNWDGRRKVGYLLALPRSSDVGEIRFRVEWPTEVSAEE